MKLVAVVLIYVVFEPRAPPRNWPVPSPAWERPLWFCPSIVAAAMYVLSVPFHCFSLICVMCAGMFLICAASAVCAACATCANSSVATKIMGKRCMSFDQFHLAYFGLVALVLCVAGVATHFEHVPVLLPPCVPFWVRRGVHWSFVLYCTGPMQTPRDLLAKEQDGRAGPMAAPSSLAPCAGDPASGASSPAPAPRESGPALHIGDPIVVAAALRPRRLRDGAVLVRGVVICRWASPGPRPRCPTAPQLANVPVNRGLTDKNGSKTGTRRIRYLMT